jgi:hypothetical protein
VAALNPETLAADDDEEACAERVAALLLVVPSERPTRLAGDDRFHGMS